MVGVRPVPDALGRVNKLELVSLEDLGRPRIDVVVNCSGVFRDLFVNQVRVGGRNLRGMPCSCHCGALPAVLTPQDPTSTSRLPQQEPLTHPPVSTPPPHPNPKQMALLDRAIKMAAEQDEPLEMNFVRKHALAQAEETGRSLRDSATRVFSNSSGSYSSNVNLAVENSSWSDEQQLQEMYLSRKSFAFNSDRPGAGGEESRDIFVSALKTVEVTFQNLDSSEISLTGEGGGGWWAGGG